MDWASLTLKFGYSDRLLVSLFAHQRGVVQAVMPMENKLVSEQEVVRELLATVGFTGVGVTMDALHCQRNNSADCRAA